MVTPLGATSVQLVPNLLSPGAGGPTCGTQGSFHHSVLKQHIIPQKTRDRIDYNASQSALVDAVLCCAKQLLFVAEWIPP